MKRTSFILLYSIFFFALNLTAQSKKIDSLKYQIQTSEIDTMIMSSYHQLSNLYSRFDLSKANAYNDTLLDLAQFKSPARFYLSALIQKGVNEYRMGNFAEGMDIWKNALKNDSIELYPIQKGNLYNNIAIGYKITQERDSVIYYLKKSVLLNETLENTTGLIANYYSLSDYYNSQSLVDSSLVYLSKLQEIAIEKKDSIALARTFVSLAKIDRKSYNYDSSNSYFKKALVLFKENDPNNFILIRGMEFEIASNYLFQEEWSLAIKLFEKIRNSEDYEKISDEEYLLIIDLKLLQAYLGKNDMFTSRNLYNKLLNFNPSSLSVKTELNINLSNYEIRNKTADLQSKKKLERALEAALPNKEYKYISDIYRILSEYHFLIQNFKAAAENAALSTKYIDSFSRQKTLALSLAQKRKFNISIKEKENLTLKAEKAAQAEQLALENKQKWQLGGGLATAILGLGVFFISYKRSEKQKKVIVSLQKELHHRIKNNLAIINSFIGVAKDNVQDETTATSLSDLQNRIDSINQVHYQLYANQDVTQLNIKNYVDQLVTNVANTFNQNNISINNETAQHLEIHPDKSFPIGLIINEFLTNSFKYAFDDNTGSIDILIEEQGNNYNLILKDSGKGIPVDFNAATSSSYGMRIMKLLSKQLQGTFNLKNNDGLELTIQFPKN